MPEDLLEEMDTRIASLRMSRTEYLKTLVRIDLHARPEFLGVPADSAAKSKKEVRRRRAKESRSHAEKIGQRSQE